MAVIHAVVMPKWGLSMSEGKVVEWLVEEGARVSVGEPLLDVETDKIASAVEATDAGVLRRRVAGADQVLPVGALLGVLAEDEASDAEIDAFVADFQASYVPPEDAAADTEPAYRFIEVNGQRLRYVERGGGEQTVLLIHGFGGDLDGWLFNLDDLAAGYRVLALDLPGHGQSGKTVADPSLAGLTAVVADFLAVVGVERAHLVGHSLGGAIAQQLALDHPDRVASLALICSAGLGAEINADYIEGFISSRTRRELKPVLEKLFADPTLVTRQLTDDVLKYKRLDGVSAALRAIADTVFAGGRQQDLLRDRLTAAGVPVLVLWGAEDDIIPAAHANGLGDGVATLALDGYGHMLQLEAAGEVNKRLLAHLDGAG